MSRLAQNSGVLHLIGDVLEHADDLAALDLVEDLAAELRVVALLIDRERAVADDRDAAIGRRDEVVPAEVLVARAAARRSACAGTGRRPSVCAYEQPCERVGLPSFL